MCGFFRIVKPHSESRFVSWLQVGLFAFYGLFQFHSAYSAFLWSPFKYCIWNPTEPFAAEIGIAVISIEITDWQDDPIRVLLSVRKAEADYIRYHINGYIIQVDLIQTLGNIIRYWIIFRPQWPGLQRIGEDIVKA